jgi:hypothetical protein
MDERDERAGKNEALFREINERIEGLNRAFEPLTGDFDVVCECARVDCAERIRLTLAAYERVRADPTHFIVASGHVDASVERVVETEPGYKIVEKRPGKPAQVAQATDPRSS